MKNKVMDNFKKTGRHNQEWYRENFRLLSIKTKRQEYYLRAKRRREELKELNEDATGCDLCKRPIFCCKCDE